MGRSLCAMAMGSQGSYMGEVLCVEKQAEVLEVRREFLKNFVNLPFNSGHAASLPGRKSFSCT